ncbi:MAG: SCO family protein [Candidatus Binatota bacterium]|nr:SCO family protein [Candidatus Binatota bacterium]
MILKSKNKLALGAVLIALSLLNTELQAHIPIPPKKGEIGRRETNVAAPNFTLINQAGQRFKFNANGGKIVLVTFVYTTCPDVCPLFSAHFAAIQRALAEEKRESYLLLSISTDPKRDTPAKMKAYAEAFKADFKHWQFLTGSPTDLAEVWKTFGVNVKDHGNGQIQHTNLTTLIDAKGVRRVDYYGDKWLVKEVLKDIKWLESEKS